MKNPLIFMLLFLAALTASSQNLDRHNSINAVFDSIHAARIQHTVQQQSLIATGCPPQGWVVAPDTVEIGLQRYLILDYTHIELRWNPVTLITDTFLVIPGACFVVYASNHAGLIIPFNDTTGVRLADDGSNCHIPNYYQIIVNGCYKQAVDQKQDFYPVSGLQYPYEIRGGKVDPILARGAYDYNPLEWVWLKSLGRPSPYTIHSDTANAWIPDTMIAYTQPMGCDDPYSNHRCGVTLSYTDRYSSNKYNINGIGDGVFPLHVAINLPATSFDPGMYPNFFDSTFRKTGATFSWTADPLPECCVDPIPAAPSKVQIVGNTSLRWTAVPGAEEYYAYVRMAMTDPSNPKKIIGWHAWHLITETELTFIPIPSVSATVQYGVSSENCAGESSITISRKD